MSRFPLFNDFFILKSKNVNDRKYLLGVERNLAVDGNQITVFENAQDLALFIGKLPRAFVHSSEERLAVALEVSVVMNKVGVNKFFVGLRHRA